MIRFDQKWHTYHYNGIKLESVSKLLSKYKPKFDREGLSKNCAKKYDVSQEAVLNQWDAKGKASTDYGKLGHSLLEYLLRYYRHYDTEILNSMITELEQHIVKYKAIVANDFQEKEPRTYINVDNLKLFTKEFLEKYDIIALERIVYSVKLGIAGTFDCLVQDKITKEYILVDWKTNAEISKEGFRGQCMNGPLSNLEACDYNYYALQLSIYQYLLQEEYSISKRLLVHITDVVKIIEVPYLKKEVEGLLNERNSI